MFRVQGAFIQNERGKVMDVSGGRDNENQNIIVWRKHGKINQQFDVVYTDQWKGEPKKGQLNSEYGLYVERPFYIQTHMASKRRIDVLGRNLVIKIANGRTTQQWYFHQQSLTIKSKSNNQSWDIQNSGKTNNMQIWSTNSGWW
jgi:hypothetical protein